jgi:hypothetical protein
MLITRRQRIYPFSPGSLLYLNLFLSLYGCWFTFRPKTAVDLLRVLLFYNSQK